MGDKNSRWWTITLGISSKLKKYFFPILWLSLTFRAVQASLSPQGGILGKGHCWKEASWHLSSLPWSVCDKCQCCGPVPSPVVSQSQNTEVYWCPDLLVFQGQRTVYAKFGKNVYLPEDAEFYFIYDGSHQRHVVIAERIEANVLQASIPGEEASEW